MKVYVVEKIASSRGRTKLRFAKSPPLEISTFTPIVKFYKNSMHIEHTYSLEEIVAMFNYVNSRQNKFIVDTSTVNFKLTPRFDYDSVWKTIHKNPLPIKKVGEFKDRVSLRTRT